MSNYISRNAAILHNKLHLQQILINFLAILSFSLYGIQLAVSIESLESNNSTSIYHNDSVLFNQEEELIGTIFRRSLIATENFENNLLFNHPALQRQGMNLAWNAHST